MDEQISSSGRDSSDPDRQQQIGAILDLDQRLQQLLRPGWPNSWLQLNLPVGAVRALLVIDGGFASTPGAIADRLGLSRTSMTGLLDRLEAEGLIARTLDPMDRRNFIVTLTDGGHTLIRQIDTARREPLGQALAQLDPDELKAFDQGLQALVEAMRRQRVAPG